MSKRTRNSDNSKRQQPVQQQRAQARQLPASSGNSQNASKESDSQSRPGRTRQASNDDRA